MKLYELKLTNFQGVKSKTFTVDGANVSILGDNATGKTTFFNALTWLLYDKASNGVKGYSPKPIGPNGEIHNLETTVEGTFSDDTTGERITFKKTLSEVYRKKRGSAASEYEGNTVDYYINNVPVRQSEYNNTIMRWCGGNAEIPKMLTMIDYFAEVMSWQDRRRILLEVCGTVTQDDVIASDPKLAELSELLIMPGTKDQRYSVDDFLKISKASMTEINKDIQSIPVRIDEISRTLAPSEDLPSLEKQLKDVRDEIEHLNLDISSYGADDIADAQDSIRRLREEDEKFKNEYESEYRNTLSETNAKIYECKTEMGRWENELGKIDVKLYENQHKAEEWRRNYERLKAEYKAEDERTFTEEMKKCPTCGQALPEDQLNELVATFEANKKAKMKAIMEEAREKAPMSVVSELMDDRTRLASAKTNAESEKAKWENKLSEIKTPEPMIPYYETQAHADFMKSIASAEENRARLLNDAEKHNAEARQTIYDAKVKESDLVERIAKVKNAETSKARIAELEEEEKTLAEQYNKAEKAVYLCELYTRKMVSALSSKVNDVFHNVRFRLFQEQINGGIKSDCEVMIPTEDGKLIPYAFANTAARMNAGLEIITVLSKFYGVTMPIVVDNAEAVTHLRIPEGLQVIRLVVSEADKELRLERYDG